MKTTLYPTKWVLKGRDKRTGRTVRRRIYEDAAGMRYAHCGVYAVNDPNVCVGADWFAMQFLDDPKWEVTT